MQICHGRPRLLHSPGGGKGMEKSQGESEVHIPA